VTVNGVLGTPGFEPDGIADSYAALAAASGDPSETWRSEVAYPG
jgi:hypothetical protein